MPGRFTVAIPIVGPAERGPGLRGAGRPIQAFVAARSHMWSEPIRFSAGCITNIFSGRDHNRSRGILTHLSVIAKRLYDQVRDLHLLHIAARAKPTRCLTLEHVGLWAVPIGAHLHVALVRGKGARTAERGAVSASSRPRENRTRSGNFAIAGRIVHLSAPAA